jgi:hypothetical protein
MEERNMRKQVLNFGALLWALGTMVGCEPEIDPNDDLCARVRCKAGTHCEATGESAQCVADATCDLVCDEGSHCELVDVQCVQAPCPPIEECVLDHVGGTACGDVTCGAGQVCCNASCGICTPPDGACIQLACEPQPNEENPCNLVDCAPNNVCEVVNGEATCVPVDVEPASCAATLCPVNTYCDDISGNAECIPLPSCDGVRCEAGQTCELQQVQCIRAPCPPQPACVPAADEECRNPCETVRCGFNTHCEAVDVTCIKAPCCPTAQCVPNTAPQACGNNECGAGTYCCNASCGICAPTGGFCTQQFCGNDA